MRAPETFDRIVRRSEEISARLNAGVAGPEFAALSKEMTDIEPVVAAIRAWRAKEKELSGLVAILEDEASDPALKDMAGEEIKAIERDLAETQKAIRVALLPKDAGDEGGAILEIRAGTGGDEAALFAGDLFRMYVKYAGLKGWRVDVLSESEGTVGGFKEIVAEVSGKGVHERLKFESGAHRVQRVPATETQGRIHTSAATVAVLPEVGEIEADIKESDLRVETMRAGGAGGQHVNKTESAIRITHLPSGIVVMMQEERSQHRNRTKAMALLRARLLDLETEKAEAERARDRKEQVGSGDRSQRIRTYNFPQGRVTDHRINLTLHSLSAILEGEGLDAIIDALAADRQARLLADQDETRED